MWPFKKKLKKTEDVIEYVEFIVEKYDGSEETIIAYGYEPNNLWVSFNTDYGWTARKTADIKTLTRRKINDNNVVSIRPEVV